MEITQEQFEEWRDHPITQEVFRIVHLQRDQIEESLGNGATLSPESMESTAIQTAKAVGNVEGLNQLLRIRLGDL